MEYFTLNNGIKVPSIGLGTYNPKDNNFCDIIKNALDIGYRLFDTASIYGTECQVGKTLKDSGLRREEYFIQSKLWIDEMGYNEVFEAFERSIDRLRVDYIDTYFIHWPKHVSNYKCVPGHEELLQSKLPYVNDDWKDRLIGTYSALEELYEKKLIRGIGLSNFLPHHIIPIIEKCKVKPVIDQLELHIGYDQPVAVKYSKDNDILCEAWSPLARGKFMDDEFIKSMADKYGVSVARFALRYLYQNGILTIPKASSIEKMKENIDIFSFNIAKEDMYLIACMVPAFWGGEHPDFRIPGVLSIK